MRGARKAQVRFEFRKKIFAKLLLLSVMKYAICKIAMLIPEVSLLKKINKLVTSYLLTEKLNQNIKTSI